MNTIMDVENYDNVSIVDAEVKSEMTTIIYDSNGFGQYAKPIKTLLCKKEQAALLCNQYKQLALKRYSESLNAIRDSYNINSSLWKDLHAAALHLQKESYERRHIGITRYKHDVPEQLFNRLSGFFPNRYTLNRFSIIAHDSSEYSVTVPAIYYEYVCTDTSFEVSFDRNKSDILGTIHLPRQANNAILRHVSAIVSNDLGHIDNVLLIAEKAFNKRKKDNLKENYVWKRLMLMKSLVSMVDASMQNYSTALYLQGVILNSKAGFTYKDIELLSKIVTILKNTQ